MSWNDRIVQYRDGAGYGLHEVFYDDAGKPWSMTEAPIGFSCDLDEGPEGIRDSIDMAFADSRREPVLIQPETGQWPGRNPSP